jgi:hypothetical protein
VSAAKSWSWAPAALALCLVVEKAEATSVVAARNPTSVVIGADSKATVADGPKVETRTICKIRSANGVYWALAGSDFQATLRSGGVTNVDKIASDAMSGKGSLSDRVLIFKAAVEPILDLVLADARYENPSVFQRIYMHPLSINFIAFSDGVPELHAIDYVTTINASNGEVHVRPNSEIALPNPFLPPAFNVTSGEADAIKRYVYQHPDAKSLFIHPAFVKKMLELEIQDEPNIVGAPVAVVKIDASGPHWVYRGVCGKR